MLITFEGIDGCGKSSQSKIIYEWLTSEKAILTAQPGGTKLGQELRSLLLDPSHDLVLSDRAELLLYLADRAQHVQAVIEPALEQGLIVLCDRYTYSTVAYQGYGNKLSNPSYCGYTSAQRFYQVCDYAECGVEADLTIWIDVPVDAAIARCGNDRIESRGREYFERVREGFQDIYEGYPERVVKVDGDRPMDAVTEDIKAAIFELMEGDRD